MSGEHNATDRLMQALAERIARQIAQQAPRIGTGTVVGIDTESGDAMVTVNGDTTPIPATRDPRWTPQPADRVILIQQGAICHIVGPTTALTAPPGGATTPDGTVLPDGTIDGQLLAWSTSSSAWEPGELVEGSMDSSERDVAVGDGSSAGHASGDYGTAYGGVAVGAGATSTGENAVAVGYGTTASGDGSTAIGVDDEGNSAAAAATNQIALGTSRQWIALGADTATYSNGDTTPFDADTDTPAIAIPNIGGDQTLGAYVTNGVVIYAYGGHLHCVTADGTDHELA